MSHPNPQHDPENVYPDDDMTFHTETNKPGVCEICGRVGGKGETLSDVANDLFKKVEQLKKLLDN